MCVQAQEQPKAFHIPVKGAWASHSGHSSLCDPRRNIRLPTESCLSGCGLAALADRLRNTADDNLRHSLAMRESAKLNLF
jgi:hypothetical protein